MLRENTLYVKKEKSSFAKREVMFLGHWIGDGLIRSGNLVLIMFHYSGMK